MPAVTYPHRRFPRSALLVLALCCALAPAVAQGTVYVPMNDSRLADSSPLILSGHVVEVSPWGEQGRPQTRYILSVDEVFKGTWSAATVTVDLPGGRGRDGALWTVAGTPQWQPGDPVLVFLSPAGAGRWTLQQFFLGGFTIIEEDGVLLATRDLSDGHPIRLPGTQSPVDGRRELAAFGQWLRDRGQGILRLPDYFLPGGHSTAERPAGKGAAEKFTRLRSPSAPWPMGCGGNGGNGLRWFEFSAGGSVRWRTHFTGQVGLPSRGVEEVQRALAAWVDVPGSQIDLTYGGITSAESGLRLNDGVNAVLFDDPYDEIGGTWQGSGVLALGGPWFSCALEEHRGEAFHPILEADIVVQDGVAEFFQDLVSPSAAAEELFAHEIGHTLGLAHSSAADSLMAPELHNDGRGANLSADDLAAVRFLYGIDTTELLPNRPKALRAEILRGLRVQLRWLDFSDNERGFRIERRRLGETYQVVGITSPNVTEWVDEDVRPLSQYHYRIRAHNDAGPSGTTNRVIVEVPSGNAPLEPTLMRAAPLSDERVRLTWQDNANNESNYVLEILFPDNDEWLRAPFLLQADSTAVNLTGLEAGRRYGFRIFARNGFGVSPMSNAAHVTTIADGIPCRVDSDSLCLVEGRFRVEVEFVDPASGQLQTASAIPSTDKTGFFWFFQPGNFELVVKMIDGRTVNDSFWFFYGGITGLEFRIAVTDTVTGQVRTYVNPAGESCGRADTSAFPQQAEALDAPPPESVFASLEPALRERLSLAQIDRETLDPFALAATPEPTTADPGAEREPPPGGDKAAAMAACRADEHTLCLLDGRLQVEARFRNPHANSREGFGKAVQGTSQSGQFWFFQLESSELVVKAIDGTDANGNLWLFFGSLTDVSYEIEVTDTLTGNQKVYYNPPGQLCGQTDLAAFQGVLSGATP